MPNIQYHINRTKKQLTTGWGTYYPSMIDQEFSFHCAGQDKPIIVRTNNKEYFIDKFGMTNLGDSLYLMGDVNGGDWVKYFDLYFNGLIVMLEQSIHDPRPILHGYTKNMLEYHHSPIDVDDELNYITYKDGKIDTATLNVLNTNIVDGTLDEYCSMVKKLWNGTNSAYNLFTYESVLTFDTYPVL